MRGVPKAPVAPVVRCPMDRRLPGKDAARGGLAEMRLPPMLCVKKLSDGLWCCAIEFERSAGDDTDPSPISSIKCSKGRTLLTATVVILNCALSTFPKVPLPRISGSASKMTSEGGMIQCLSICFPFTHVSTAENKATNQIEGTRTRATKAEFCMHDSSTSREPSRHRQSPCLFAMRLLAGEQFLYATSRRKGQTGSNSSLKKTSRTCWPASLVPTRSSQKMVPLFSNFTAFPASMIDPLHTVYLRFKSFRFLLSRITNTAGEPCSVFPQIDIFSSHFCSFGKRDSPSLLHISGAGNSDTRLPHELETPNPSSSDDAISPSSKDREAPAPFRSLQWSRRDEADLNLEGHD
mmetsp:Transcript_61671/g.151783  ORF Transcript_61671/g.151783 Transcript_61671/m.151783 type:complete len:350 (-) Transcript_61671:1158-2207(-)